MADYRAMNRKAKGLDAERIRLASMIYGTTGAAGMLMRAPKVNLNPGTNYKVPMMPDLQIALKERKEQLAWEAGLTTNTMGVWYNPEKTPAGKKLDAAINFLPPAALSEATVGASNLAIHGFNPENRKYPDEQVPLKIFGHDVSGGKQMITQQHQSPNMWTALAAIPGVVGRSLMAPEKTDLEKKLYEKVRHNPHEYRERLNELTPQQKSQNSIDAKIKSNEKDYNDLVSMLRDTGISEEEMYRGVVVGPDGQVNLNANTQAALDGIGYAGSSLRFAELIGYGLGRPIAVAARATTKGVRATVANAAKFTTERAYPRAAIVASDVAMAPAGVLLGVKGAAGRTSPDALSAASGGLLRGSPVRAAREAAGGQSYKGFAVVKPDAALDELAKNEWKTGSTMDITSTGELLDSINYGGYGRRTDPRLTSPSDTNNINIGQLTPDDIDRMSPETLDLLQNQPVLQQLGREGTVSLRGINEPVRVRVQKYPTRAEFNKRLSGERLSGADAKLKQELYDEAIALIEESGGYWRVTDAETGKNIGGMDIAHRQHYVEGGKAIDTSGRPNVEVQGRGSNRLQGAEGVGGAEGFSKWWKANKNTASNRAILEALLYEIY